MALAAMATGASVAGASAAYGGVWEQSLHKCAIEPFENATGKTVEVTFGAPLQWLNQIAASPH